MDFAKIDSAKSLNLSNIDIGIIFWIGFTACNLFRIL
jgi:hypothetical protein